MGKATSIETALYGLASFIFRVFHWIADTILTAVVAALVLLFALQFTHSPKLLHWRWISEIQRAADPVLAEISSWVRMDWPAETGFSFIPLALAFFIWLVKIGVDGIFLKGGAFLSRLGRACRPPARGRTRSS